MADYAALPGGDLIEAGLAELKADEAVKLGFLVAMATERLVALGVAVPTHDLVEPRFSLYRRLEEEEILDPHSNYLALVGRLFSFIHALERERSQESAALRGM